MTSKKPKPEDFKVGEPITDEERQHAQAKLLDELVAEERAAQYLAAISQWNYDNVDTR